MAPTDFDQYCVTAPTDSRLPGNVSGKQVCGLFDITASKFGVATNNLVNYVESFGGRQSEVFDGIDVAVNARLSGGVFLTGGFATGITHFDLCDAFVDNPKTGFGIVSSAAGTLPPTPGNGTTFQYCKFDTSWLTHAKLTGSYTLPWQDIQIGGVMQNLPGQQILAYWNIVQADATPSLGRALSGGANTSRTIPLIKPGTMYTPRRTQLDLRFAKSFRLGGTRKLQVMADVFNAFNSNAAVGATSNAGEPPAALNITYSPTTTTWLKPLNILQARYFEIGAQFNF